MNDIIYDEIIFYYRYPRNVRVVLCESRFLVDLGDGKGLIEKDWYKDEKTQKLFIPKRKNFISLVKQALREGDWD